ncbi:Uncharacterized conserved protein YjgD, DUF1641 family [Halogeometricum rufum]|jgi:uncharacterized protein YjgD (DUF1641 family)|uniref:Uncharacterized conserved protein YjgD, DUF1641 family n=1 Tax=Halogeometricum rufum TaxID=553469 RepID=A0A1I6FY11_9EURY|nr:DUF1641 domain-containing protein [Halogeometricum rufum]SFR34835.1 Uncharacterized conserved protein YjgD, DUF1641 family [Halogeometricum rufum]
MSESNSEVEFEAATTDLERAIEENPEAVARFVERLDVVNELLDVVELGSGALEDDMVAELTGTAATLAEAGDAAATPETVRLAAAVGENGDELSEALETLVELQRSGTLDDVVALADVVSLASGALEDDMVAELASTGSALGEVVDEASDPDTVRGLTVLVRAVGRASDPDDPPEPIGLRGVIRALRDGDVRAGVGYFVSIAKSVGASLRR